MKRFCLSPAGNSVMETGHLEILIVKEQMEITYIGKLIKLDGVD